MRDEKVWEQVLLLIGKETTSTSNFSQAYSEMKAPTVSLASFFLVVGSAHGFAPSLTAPSSCVSRATSSMTSLHMASNDNSHSNNHLASIVPQGLKASLLAASMLVGSAVLPLQNNPMIGLPPANAAGSTVVGSLKGSGLVFKDTLNIERFEGAYYIVLTTGCGVRFKMG